jgi:hypothetical protein
VEDPGEELVGSYLREVLGCDFVEFKTPLKFVQGEIDVVGINSSKKEAYFCEVTTHLLGLQYVGKDNRPNNVKKLIEKFTRDIEYAKSLFLILNIHSCFGHLLLKLVPIKQNTIKQEM